MLRYWVGDVIGIMVVTPFALIALDAPAHAADVARDRAAVRRHLSARLALVFGYAQERQFQLFYVLFLPIVWMAVRTGFEGVTVGILVTQLGLILGFMLFPGGDARPHRIPGADAGARRDRARRRRTGHGAPPHRDPSCACIRNCSHAWRGSAAWASSPPRWRTN